MKELFNRDGRTLRGLTYANQSLSGITRMYAGICIVIPRNSGSGKPSVTRVSLHNKCFNESYLKAVESLAEALGITDQVTLDMMYNTRAEFLRRYNLKTTLVTPTPYQVAVHADELETA